MNNRLRFRLILRVALPGFVGTLLLVNLSSAPIGRSQPATVAIQFKPPAALPPPPVVNDPGSGRSQGGGSRGCGANRPEEIPTPLVPLQPVGDKTVRWGLTTVDRPTFWLHTPKGIKDGALIVLVLQDGVATSHRVEFQVPPNTPSAVLSLPIPPSAASLQPGTSYRWEVRLFCNSGDSTVSESGVDVPIVFSGGIQRTLLSAQLQRQLSAAKTPRDRATLYASNGFWYDSLTTLGLQGGKSSTDPAIVRAWADLLRQANLESAASTPISRCCQPEKE